MYLVLLLRSYDVAFSIKIIENWIKKHYIIIFKTKTEFLRLITYKIVLNYIDTKKKSHDRLNSFAILSVLWQLSMKVIKYDLKKKTALY